LNAHWDVTLVLCTLDRMQMLKVLHCLPLLLLLSSGR
jgi:hypothetical protein